MIYAINEDSPHHDAATSWLDGALSTGVAVGFTWIVMRAFVRLTSDAHLAAIAVAHRATVVTFDGDFGRFPGVRWTAPSG